MNKKQALEKLEEGYKKKDFVEFVRSIKKEWKNIGEEYFEKIEEMTGFKWSHKKYTCYLSLNVPGFSDPANKKFDEVMISNILPANIMKYVIAHELFHLYYFYIITKEKINAGAATTAVIESIPLLYMVVDSRLNKLWPEINLERVRHSYPEVDKIIDRLTETYKNEKDFIKLIKKAIEISK